MSSTRWLLLGFLLCGAFVLAFQAEPGPFLAQPYLQLGDAAQPAREERLALLWHTGDTDARWSVQVRKDESEAWRAMQAPVARRIALPSVPAHRVWRAELTGLTPGARFTYQVLQNGKAAFSAVGRARKPATEPQRFVVFGDCAADTQGQRAIAYQTFMADPDFVFIPGDIVYSNGRISEYRTKFFPVYNSEETGAEHGAPLLRSTLFIAAPGNHDLLLRNFGRFNDLLAYYYYWAQPLNGPTLAEGDPNLPALQGTDAQMQAFREAAAANYPRMANFSFDYGNAHWTVIDSNMYTDWTTPALRDWVKQDLAAAKKATWRFVGFHHPGFNSAKTHFKDQWMRVLSPVFEEGGVDIVFAGHVHNYQRSYPLQVKVKGPKEAGAHEVEAEWKLDQAFDGKEKTKPNGVIYLVTGAGGAKLYNPEQQGDPASWQTFTSKYVADQNSFTQIEIDGKKLTAKQVGADGKTVDQYTITK